MPMRKYKCSVYTIIGGVAYLLLAFFFFNIMEFVLGFVLKVTQIILYLISFMMIIGGAMEIKSIYKYRK